jgi:hypothetical protein
VYREIWNALNDWMYELFTAGRGINVPFFGLATWAVKDVYEGEVRAYARCTERKC